MWIIFRLASHLSRVFGWRIPFFNNLGIPFIQRMMNSRKRLLDLEQATFANVSRLSYAGSLRDTRPSNFGILLANVSKLPTAPKVRRFWWIFYVLQSFLMCKVRLVDGTITWRLCYQQELELYKKKRPRTLFCQESFIFHDVCRASKPLLAPGQGIR